MLTLVMATAYPDSGSESSVDETQFDEFPDIDEEAGRSVSVDDRNTVATEGKKFFKEKQQ